MLRVILLSLIFLLIFIFGIFFWYKFRKKYKIDRKLILKYKKKILKNEDLINIVKKYGYSIFSKYEYKSGEKNEIVEKVLNEYDSKLNFKSEIGLDKENYKLAKFENFDNYFSNWLIEGYISDKQFIISQVKTSNNIYSLGVDEKLDLFEGFVVIIKLPVSINSYISILYNGLKTYMNDYYCFIDDKEFLLRHDVYSNNQQVVVKLLNKNVTKRILELEEKMRVCFEIKIIDDLLYVRFQTSDIFKTRVYNIDIEALNLAKYIYLIEGTKKFLNIILDAVNKLDK